MTLSVHVDKSILLPPDDPPEYELSEPIKKEPADPPIKKERADPGTSPSTGTTGTGQLDLSATIEMFKAGFLCDEWSPSQL